MCSASSTVVGVHHHQLLKAWYGTNQQYPTQPPKLHSHQQEGCAVSCCTLDTAVISKDVRACVSRCSLLHLIRAVAANGISNHDWM
jgi:hypothetical protein